MLSSEEWVCIEYTVHAMPAVNYPLSYSYTKVLWKNTRMLFIYFLYMFLRICLCVRLRLSRMTLQWKQVWLCHGNRWMPEQNGVEQSRADRSRRIKAQRSSQRGEEERRTLLNTTSSTSSPSWSLQPQLFLSSISVCCQTLQSETRSDGSTLTLAPKKEAY